MAIRLEDLPLRAQQQAVAKLQQEQLRKQKRAAPKYHNEETEHLGIHFASRKEARRYEVLLRMKLAYNKGRPYRHGGKAL